MRLTKTDENFFGASVASAFYEFKNNNITRIPKNFDFELSEAQIFYNEISSRISLRWNCLEDKYFNSDSSVIADSKIIYLVKDKTEKFPLFIGELKRQGTNLTRISEGKKKQSVGNAIERFWKNYEIFGEYCATFDDNFFPYTLFCYGCDFSEEYLTKTTKGKISPAFGDLNKFNPWFDNSRKGIHGGTCYCQGTFFTKNEIIDKVYPCLETGLHHYLKKSN